jgi:acyl dehydratase
MTPATGDSATLTRRFGVPDVDAYLALGGAPAPAGLVPEPLLGALFSCLLGVHLPGRGTKYLKQETAFLAPARLETVLTATVTVTRVRPEKRLVDLETACVDAAGELLCRGRALVLVDEIDS